MPGGGGIGGGPISTLGKQNGSSQPGMITTELMIPGQKCGLIIGKNGETIKGLQVSV
jgi:hypothetical protein